MFDCKFVVKFEDESGIPRHTIKEGVIREDIGIYEKAQAIMVQEAGKFITEHEGATVYTMDEDYISVQYPSSYGTFMLREFSIQSVDDDAPDMEYRYRDYDCE